MSRQRRIPTPSWQHEGGVGDLTANRMKAYGLVAVVALVIAAAGIIGWGFLSDYLDDRNRPGSTAVEVNDYRYSVRDYVKRAKLYVTQIGGTASASIVLPTVTQNIIEEGILTEAASEKGAVATDEEIKAKIATLMGITADDPNYDARFQEELATTGLTAEQYTAMARSSVLQDALIKVFESEVPATLESVHYRQIRVATQEEADDLKAQIDGGADFAELAKEFSLDTSTKEEGGDSGWVPRGILAAAQEDLLFDLEVNQTVVFPTTSGVTIYQVVEKDDARAPEAEQKTTLGTQAFNDWLEDKVANADVTNDMDLATGDPDKIRYVVEHAALTAQ